jgi:hypothetical protein
MGNVNELKDFTRGQLDSALMKIGHDVDMGTAEAIEAFLRGELVITRPIRVWKTWKTIKLGTGLKTADDFCKALWADRNIIGSGARDILSENTFKVSETEQKVELIDVSVRELGFKEITCYEDICKRASELGLDLCPAEVGPQLRLQWRDQPNGTCVAVAMNTINDRVFFVKRHDDGEKDLYSANSIWRPFDHLVFLRRKTA